MDMKVTFINDTLNAYRETLVWQSTDGESGEPISADIEWSELALGEAKVDVEDFVRANWDDVKGMDAGQVGHDFCLTRNRHGAGFWDRGLGALGDRLSEACRPYGTQDGYVGDDGLLYLHG